MVRSLRSTFAALVIGSLLGAGIAHADDGDSLASLRLELAKLLLRIDALELANAELEQGEIAPGLSVPSEQNLNGESVRPNENQFRPAADFRLRYESIELAGSETQERVRIRARASVTRKFSENMEFGFGLATGGDSPTSSTQTLGDGGSKKGIALDLAYVDWQPAEDLHILAGKFMNHLFKVPSQTLLWDDEWRPEGFGIRYDDGSYFASLLGTWLESDSLTANREFTAGAQAGIHRPVGEARLTAGIGYFDFGVSNSRQFYGSDADFAGNSFSCAEPLVASSCVYSNNYREVELFTALDFEGKFYTANVYAHYLRNIDADRFDNGWTIGSQFRFAVRNRPMQLHYFYRHLEADAVFALLTDSDFGGGGTDAIGHYFKAGWSMSPSLVFSLTYFDNDVGANQGDERKFNRVQLNADFNFK